MTPAQRRYVATEALIGATISALLSIGFVLLLFGRSSFVPVTGAGGLILDGVPQGFAIALMATLVPTLLTRRRLARGTVAPLPPRRRLGPAGLPARALAAAVAGAALTSGLTALLPVVGVDVVPMGQVLIAKPFWGLLLGGGVAAVMTRAALATPVSGIVHQVKAKG